MRAAWNGRLVRSLVLASAFGAGLAAAGADRTDEILWLRVTIADRDRDIPRLQRLDLDVAGVDVKAQTLDIVGDRAAYAALRDEGFIVSIESDFSETLANNLSSYLDPSEIEAKLDAYAAAYPALAKKIQYATTEQGRPAYALKISDNVAVEEDEPAIFFVAQHHAREVMTSEIAIDIADQLLTGYGVDPTVTAWVNAREIFVVPTHNPDGSAFVFNHGPTWRKNRRDNGDRTFGVDLNRNYPFHWNACGGSSGDTSNDGYRGPSPGSEPETAGLAQLARDQRPVIDLSYHSYGEQVLIPYGCTGVHPAENAVYRTMSSDLASRLISDDGTHWYAPGAVWELLYAEDGEANGWFYGDNATYSFEIEANSSSVGFQPSYAQWRDSTVTRNRPAWRYLLDRIDGPGISGHTTDACTGAPIAAAVGLDEIVFTNGETPRTSDPVYGRYQWLTNGGTFHLRAAKTGYAGQVWPVTVDRARVDRPLRLVPSGSNAVAVGPLVIDDASGDGDGEADPGEAVTLSVPAINTGADPVTAVTASLSTADSFVTITKASASYGTIGAGATLSGDGFGLSIAAGTRDDHVATLHLHFAAASTLCASDDDVSLRITGGRSACAVVENLDLNPGWAIANQSASGWAFGPPAGDNGANGPAAAFTGANVYGTNLAGAYGNNADDRLTAGPYDLHELRHAVMSYRRWLDNEPGADIASVELSKDGGTTWLPLTSGFAYGEGWEPQSVDIASLADGQPDVRIRFRLRSDATGARSGFYVDDFRICGERLARAPNGVGATLAVAKNGSDLQFDWSAAAVDAAHDAPTGYRVYRGAAPAAGFVISAQPSSTSALESNGAVSPGTGFYLIVAVNSGGTSPDQPLP
jgi:hypothetical protein